MKRHFPRYNISLIRFLTDALPFSDEKVEISREAWDDVIPLLNVIIVGVATVDEYTKSKNQLSTANARSQEGAIVEVGNPGENTVRVLLVPS